VQRDRGLDPLIVVISSVRFIRAIASARRAADDQLGDHRVSSEIVHGVREGFDARLPPGTLKTWISLGDGTNVSGSSALMRHSMSGR
jgi:hypothetical protein